MTRGALLDGRTLAAQIRANVKARVTRAGTPPGLAVILVGEHPASLVYVNAKVRACAEVGIISSVHRLPVSASMAEVIACIDALNKNPDVHGILIQLPLPHHLNANDILPHIAPEKDVDGLTPTNLGLLMSGRPRLVPCTPKGVLALIHHVAPDLAGLHAVIVGRSLLVGRPLGQLLLHANATITHVHSKTRDLSALTRQADILVAAAGSPGLITGDMVKDGAIVIDVGITRVPVSGGTELGGMPHASLVGDVDFVGVQPRARAITPVPGGVGPMTIACLLENTLIAAGVEI